jgi:ribosome maturation factor RimP
MLGRKTTADYGMGLAPIFFSAFLHSAATDERFLFSRSGTIAKVAMTNEEIQALLAPAIGDLGLELVGIEFSPGHGGSLLRVYVDVADRPVTIDDCERASREISALLDVNDPVAGRYTLEVSSPGLDRPLFTPEHFTRFLGQMVKINVNLPIDGRRRFHGMIKEVDGDRIVIEQDGALVTIVHANIAKARLAPDYAALGLAAARREYEEGAPKKRRKKEQPGEAR